MRPCENVGCRELVWLEDMVRVSFDSLEKVVGSNEQFGDDRRVASAVGWTWVGVVTLPQNHAHSSIHNIYFDI